ncbi:MAG: hypothetical protein KDK65_01175 [Chlamydiia bacterium]|nr:hypothetical protein [Chlamydiia bacterium]
MRRESISFDALLILAKKHRKIIQRGVWIGTILFGTFAFLRPVQFSVDSVFIDKANHNSFSDSLTGLFSQKQLLGNDSETAQVLASRRVVEEAIQESGWQGRLYRSGFFVRVFQRLCDNIHAELAFWTKMDEPFVAERSEQLYLSQLRYTSEYYGDFYLMLEGDQFSLSDAQGEEMGKGRIGVPFTHPQIAFTLHLREKGLSPVQEYYLRVEPLQITVQKVLRDLYVKPNVKAKRVINITFRGKDRFNTPQFLNQVMHNYRDYLSDEQKRFAKTQLEYLQQRQEGMVEGLKSVLVQHAELITRDVATTGFMGSEKEVDFLATQLTECQKQLLEIDWEIKRMLALRGETPCAYFDPYSNRNDPRVIQEILTSIRDLERQKESLHVFSEVTSEPLFEGIDLPVAQQLYLTYAQTLSQAEEEAKHNQFILEQLQNPQFELSSLSTILTDSVSQEHVVKVSQLSMALKDTQNRSHKEQERLQEELNLEKAFLAQHLAQTVDLLQIKQQLFERKIASLNIAMLTLINRQIGIYQKNFSDYVNTRLSNLEGEKQLLLAEQENLNAKLSTLPDRWVTGQLVDNQLAINRRMAEEVTKYVVSKDITGQLEVSQSTPLDFAKPPLHPDPPLLLLFSFLGAFLGGGIPLVAVMLTSLKKGLPANKQSLNCVVTEPVAFCQQNTLILTPWPHNPALAIAKKLQKQGKNPLIIDGTFSTPSEKGLLHYLEGDDSLTLTKVNGISLLPSGGRTPHSLELLHSSRFHALWQKLATTYDPILFLSHAPITSSEAHFLAAHIGHTLLYVSDETLPDIEHFDSIGCYFEDLL